jgi:hypothetical protein
MCAWLRRPLSAKPEEGRMKASNVIKTAVIALGVVVLYDLAKAKGKVPGVG